MRTGIWIGALLLFLGIMLLTWLMARHAWCATPAIANFRGFAEPGNTKAESKISYLFMPLVTQMLVFAAPILFFRETVARHLKYVLVLLGMGLLLLFGTAAQSVHALSAAGWPTSIWPAHPWNDCR